MFVLPGSMFACNGITPHVQHRLETLEKFDDLELLRERFMDELANTPLVQKAIHQVYYDN
jgi:hypothetical protein